MHKETLFHFAVMLTQSFVENGRIGPAVANPGDQVADVLVEMHHAVARAWQEVDSAGK